jgi:GNAT superfamily N-acetyltransferase
MALRELFEEYGMLRAVIDCVLEKRLGRAVTDDAAIPSSARLDIGCYAIFGGDASTPGAARLVREAPAPIELVGPDDQAWRDLFVAVHGSRLSDRPMRTFANHALDRERLRAMADAVPDGFEVRRLDVDLARQLDDALVPHGLQTYPSVEEFIEHGLGFGVLRSGRLASVSTSYTRSIDRVEVSIATHPDFRGRGLARVAAATMLGHCMDQGLSPEWSASNPVSKHLALTLGYLPGPICDIFYLE